MQDFASKLRYRVGLPGWKLAARVGMPLRLRVHVMHDKEAGVFLATSPDLDGLVTEAATVEELQVETLAAVQLLLDASLGLASVPEAQPDYHLLDTAACAA